MKLVHSIATVGGLTLLSRVLGFVRDTLIASILGVSGLTDAFFVAFKLPNFFRRFFAEGAFNAAFVPLFSGTLVKEGEAAAKAFAQNIFSLMTIGLIGFVGVFELAMPLVIMIIAPGFEATPERFELALQMAHITFPYIFFISLAAMISGVLNTLGRFGAAAFTPSLLNMAMIAGVLAVGFGFLSPQNGLSYAVFSAGILQLGWLWFSAHRLGYTFRLTWPRITPQAKRLLTLGIPGAFGAGVVQINLLIDQILASLLPTGSISFLFYADRLNQLPLAVIGIAISTALLPELSKRLKEGREADAHRAQNKSLELSLALSLPAMVALVLLSSPIISTLFERGEFSALDTSATSAALAAFAVGLPAYILIKVFSTQFFAREDTKTPVKIAVFTVALNIAFSLIFIGPLAHVGLALSTALASWVNAACLGFVLLRRGWFYVDSSLKKKILRLVMANAVFAGFLLGLQSFIPFPEHFFHKLFILSTYIGSGLVFFVGTSLVLNIFSLTDFKHIMKK